MDNPYNMAMRTAYQEHMKDFSHDLIEMCDKTKNMLSNATNALFNADLGAAESVMSTVDTVEEMRQKCERRAFELLALEGPVARDLRQVVSGTYIVEDLARMSALSVHIAKIARRRHPEKAVPEDIEAFFKEMSRICMEISDSLREILETYDAELALKLAEEDDAIDDVHQHLFVLLTQREWVHSTTNAVDVTLLSRFYERYSDHAVNIGARVVYLATGRHPEEYVRETENREREAHFARHFDEIQRRYGSGL